uniref:Heparosan-N-sulfate-glucuronate 5-epimerase n=1 Tax=Meloidogyne floridensis TaxID=298350 RepID=A0A915P0F5_9BILA
MFILPKPFYLLILLIISTIFLLFLILRLPSISYQTNQCQHLWDSSECKNLNNSLNWHPITCFIDENNSFDYFTSNIPPRLFKNKNKMVAANPIEQFSNVAIRQRIKCLKPENGLPMSVQWSPIPYFYPVQILQFGFDYFMRNRTEQRKLIERMLSNKDDFLVLKSGEKGFYKLNMELEKLANFQLFSDLPILLFSAKIESMDASFVIFFEERIGGNLKRRKLKLEFRQWPNGSALTLLNSKSTLSDALNFIPISIQFSGPLQLQLTSIRQKNFAHKEIFLRVAEWLLKNQDDRGGWPIPVERIFNKDEEENKLFLSAGWYSAMAQGHALSFLARAFNATGDERFLLAGERACDLFELPTSKGGIKNQLFGYDWYEEYPTLPSGTFVLNGFIYALVGLNDFSSFYNENKNSSNFSSKKLFFNGLNSLRSLLPLFDTGQRSLYDLRHVQLKGNLRPNIARWDYHSLHKFQKDG